MTINEGQIVRGERDRSKLSEKALVALVFLSAFPYLFPNPFILSGIQPYALIFSLAVLVILLFGGMRINIEDELLAVLGIGTTIAVFIAIISIAFYDLSGIAREISAYMNLFFVAGAFVALRKASSLDLEPYFKICIGIWLLVGLLQLFVDRALFSNYMYHTNTSATRGVFGLSTEPSMYGIQLFFFLYLVKGFKRGKIAYYLLIAAWGVLVVRSATSLIFIGAFFFAELFDSESVANKIGWILGVSVGVVAVIVVLFTVLADTRLVSLINQAMNDGLSSLISDASTNGRVTRITDAIDSASKANFLPQGFGEKYGSAWGGAMNHLGFFSLFFILAVPAFFSRYYKTTSGKIVGYIIVLVLFFSTVQLSNPTIGLLIGIASSKSILALNKTAYAKARQVRLHAS